MIEVKDLVKIYDKGKENEMTALDGVSFDIKDGEILGICGGMGSGKSTLLEILSGNETADNGSVVIDGVNILGMKGKKASKLRLKKFGLILTDFSLVEERTVLENIEMPLLVAGAGVKKRDRFTKCLTAAKSVGLFTSLDSVVGALSGGQKQKVAIARAIVGDPDYIIADEPTQGLDAVTSKDVLDTFVRLKKSGKTVIMVTNEPRVTDMCDRVIYLSQGKVVEK